MGIPAAWALVLCALTLVHRLISTPEHFTTRYKKSIYDQATIDFNPACQYAYPTLDLTMPIRTKPRLSEFTLGPNATVATILPLIEKYGCCIVRGAVSPGEITKMNEDMQPHVDEAANNSWEGEFFSSAVVRVDGLPGKSKRVTENLVFNKNFVDLSHEVLDETVGSWFGEKCMWFHSKIVLSVSGIILVRQGGHDQALHRDDAVHCNKHATATDKWTKNRETAVSMFLAGSKCTGANGATRIIPGSHVWGPTRVPKEEETLYAELDPGDCMYMVSSLYHAGSRNQTADQERYLYTAFYTKGYLRAEENQYLSYPLEAVKQYTPEQQELLGYSLNPPMLGYVNHASPGHLLGHKIDMSDEASFGKQPPQGVVPPGVEVSPYA